MLVKFYREDGSPYTESTQEMVGGTQENPVYGWVQRHLMFPVMKPVGSIIKVQGRGYGSTRYFRIESEGRGVVLPWGYRPAPRGWDSVTA